jgi:hypothetical protein
MKRRQQRDDPFQPPPILPMPADPLADRIPLYKIKHRSRVRTVHEGQGKLAGAPVKMKDGTRYMVGTDKNLVKVEHDKLSKKQRNKLKKQL